MKTILTIPEPCHENWHSMTPTQKGRFCNSCNKEVIDFTQTPKSELARVIKKGGDICGRFKPQQLNTPLPSVSRSEFRRNAALLGFTSLLAIGTPVLGQETSEPVEAIAQIAVVGRVATESLQPPTENVVTLQGVVTDGNNPLPGAHVTIKGTRIAVQTDFDGHFKIAISDRYKNSEITLEISYIGFVTHEKKVSLSNKKVEVALTELEEDVLGGLAIVYRPNIFQRFLNLFR